jgi:hypothetical protein
MAMPNTQLNRMSHISGPPLVMIVSITGFLAYRIAACFSTQNLGAQKKMK